MRIKDNVYLKNYFLMLVPTVVFMLFMVVAVGLFNRTHMDMLQQSYAKNLTAICIRAEENVQGVIETINTLSFDNDMMYAITKQAKAVNQEDIYKITTRLNGIRTGNEYVDSAFFINRVQKKVYGTNGTYQMREFFEDVYRYNEYSLAYWTQYQAPYTDSRIFAPSVVKKFNGNEIVIPIVFSRINGEDLNGFMVINIKIANVFTNLNASKLTPNSFYQIIDKKNKIHYEQGGVFDKDGFDDSFYQNCFDETTTSFITHIGREKFLVVSYSPSESILGYAYVAFVPEKDIGSMTSTVLELMVWAGILLFGVILYLTRKNVEYIYRPIHKIIDSMGDGKNNTNKNNPIARLQKSIEKIQKTNKELRTQIKNAMTVGQEREIITILNQNAYYAEETVDFLMSDVMEQFQYPFFCSVIINIELTEKFYDAFNAVEYNNIYQGLKDIIQEAFSVQYPTYMIPYEASDTFYVLLNLETDTCEKHIGQTIENLKKYLVKDMAYVKFNVGFGGIYSGISGLKKSHNHATVEISNKVHLDNKKLLLNLPHSSRLKFTQADEKYIAEACNIGQTERTIGYIKKLVMRNLNNGVSAEDIKELFSRVLYIILHAASNQNIEMDLSGKSNVELIREIVENSPESILNTIAEFLRKIADKQRTDQKVDIDVIAKYVKSHFHDSECNLEKVAETFGVSAKYLSKKFKDLKGISFTEYVAELRIEEAAVLLVQTNNSVAEIGEEVGYPIVSTFIRAFKKIKGESPSVFRKRLKG